MEQHPIPQEISTYKFRLVGDMTLTQFFQLAGGLLVSLIIYSTNIYPIIKWPLMIVSALIGVAIAFLPFEDRPLDKWILAFLKSVYSPTIFRWKSGQPQNFFAPETSTTEHGEVKVAQEPLPQNPVLKKFEEAENSFLSKITGLFSNTQTDVQKQQQTVKAPVTLEENTSTNAALKIPETGYVKFEKQREDKTRPKVVVEEDGVVYKKPEIETVSPAIAKAKESPEAKTAVFSTEAAPPSPPSKPNTVAGQVFNRDGKIIESAILEIQDSGGRPVRAVKTNKLGHFLIVTPLDNGTYKIITEKEGYGFDPVRFEAKGDIIPPIAIQPRQKLVIDEKK